MADKFDKAVEIGDTPPFVSFALNRAHHHIPLHTSQRPAQRGSNSADH